MLLDSLPDGILHWHHALDTAHLLGDGSIDLTFRNGVTERFDLVVGADGAWSRIRPLVSDARPIYSGVTFVELNFEDAEARYPEIAKLVGHGMMFALGESKAFIGHHEAGTRLSLYAALRAPEDWIANGGLDLSSSEATRSSLAAYFSGWSETLRQNNP